MAEPTTLQQPHAVASSIVAAGTSDPAPFPLPRVTIRFCTQCKWMLRAAYFAQELLSTFSTSLGEVALQPSTGGTFTVTIQHSVAPSADTPPETTIQTKTLWDRKTDGGFPETKELKRRVRDVIEPGRNLGHVDRDHKREEGKKNTESEDTTGASEQQQQQQSGGGMSGQPGGENTGPSGPREPTSASALQAHSQDQQQPQGGQEERNPDPIRKGHSRPMIPAGNGPASQSQPASGEYQSRMAEGGVMPLVKPPGEARNEEARANMEESTRRKEECEDCQ